MIHFQIHFTPFSSTMGDYQKSTCQDISSTKGKENIFRTFTIQLSPSFLYS